MDNQNVTSNSGEDIVRQQIEAATSSMLPSISAPIYRSAWHDLQDYRTQLNLTGPTTIRHVFSFLAKKYQDKVWVSPGTLWTRYSMLKMMIRIREGNVVDDGSIMACETWLKGLSRVHCPKQSTQLSKEEVARFLIQTKDTSPIDLRVLLIFGFNLGLRTVDLKKLQWKNVSRHADGLRINIDWATKTDQGAKGNWYFIAKEQDSRVCGPTLFAEYHRIVQEADPQRLNGDLWLKVVKTKTDKWIVVSARGRNWITSIQSIVAKNLGLPNPELYTGHCFRRTSAQWQADAGATALELQNQFGWKNTAMATVYTGQSIAARSASSRRCMLSGEVPSIAEELPTPSTREGEYSATTMQRQSPPQAQTVTSQANMPWPLNITGQNINVYFGCSPAIGAIQQSLPASNGSVPQGHLDLKIDAGEKGVCTDSDMEDVLMNVSDLESICSADMACTLPEIAAAVVDDLQRLNAGDIAAVHLAKGKGKKVAKKIVDKVRNAPKTGIKPKAKPKKAIELELQSMDTHSIDFSSSVTGRPQRVRKTTIHSNPYSRNIKGFVAPKE
jgi:integrase